MSKINFFTFSSNVLLWQKFVVSWHILSKSKLLFSFTWSGSFLLDFDNAPCTNRPSNQYNRKSSKYKKKRIRQSFYIVTTPKSGISWKEKANYSEFSIRILSENAKCFQQTEFRKLYRLWIECMNLKMYRSIK